jgi:glycogen synthase
MKKILMIGWELPPFNSGGLGVACYYIASYLSKKIKLIFSLPKKLPINKVNFDLIFADEEVKILESYKNFKKYIPLEIFEEVLTYGYRLLEKIKKENIDFDIIHAHDWLGGLAGIYLKENLKKPLIVHIHSTEIERTGNNPNLAIYNIEKEILQKADLIISVSNLTKNIINKNYEIKEDKIFVLYNGIDLNPNEYEIIPYILNLKNENYKIILFVGRLVLQKGPDYLLSTIKYVTTYIPKVKYIFAGSGDMLDSLIKKAYYENLLNYVIFAGFLREKELWSLYKLSDVLVMPSVFDPFGLVALEAIKFKLPIIISKTSGVGENLNNCLKVDYWDIKKMSNYITGILKYEPLKNEISNNLYNELKKFDWEDRVNELLKIYQKI